jgi:hypothetical protein
MILSIILSAASLIAWGFSFIFFKNYLRRRTDPEWILAEWKEEINRLTADMDAAADRNVTLVEDRIKSLKERIKEADRRIALSLREEDKRRTQEAAYAALGRMAVPPGISPGPERAAGPLGTVDPFGAAAIGRPAEYPPVSAGPGPEGAGAPGAATSPRGLPGASPETALPGEAPQGAMLTGETSPGPALPGEIPPEAASGPPVLEEPAPPSGGPRFVRSPRPVEPKPPSFAERVAELSKAGFSSAMIAANLGVPLAEVELAIAITEGKTFL